MAFDYCVGIDEVGRGPLAGPVAVGAFLVVQDRKSVQRLLRGVRDSKQLREKEREEWFMRFSAARVAGLVDFKVSFVGPVRIDRIGIVRAVQLALNHSLKGFLLSPRRTKILLDGRLIAPAEFVHQESIVRGDATEPLIAAASIVAKVLRDRRMVQYARLYPQYGFERHKGYGTAEHLQVLHRYGLSPLHRESFCQRILTQ
jgi:ribonuclease HII